MAFAGMLFQFLAVENFNSPARVRNNFFLLQFSRNIAQARAVHAKQAGNAFLRKYKFIIFTTVLKHQQPVAETFFYLMKIIADNPLRKLLGVKVHILDHFHSQPGIGFKFTAENFCADLQRGAGDRNFGPAIGNRLGKDSRQSGAPFSADHHQLAHSTVFQNLHLRKNSGQRKIYIINLVPELVNIFPGGIINNFSK